MHGFMIDGSTWHMDQMWIIHACNKRSVHGWDTCCVVWWGPYTDTMQVRKDMILTHGGVIRNGSIDVVAHVLDDIDEQWMGTTRYK